MPGPAPKPAAARVRSPKPQGGEWVGLPSEGRKGKPPALPLTRKWRKSTRDLWALWWSSPQAVMWDQSGKTLWRWAELADAAAAGEINLIAAGREMRAMEDDHGMSPAAMQRRRWFVVADEVAQARTTPQASDARERLRAVGD